MQAGVWDGHCVAPGVVRIGCTTMSVNEWRKRGEEIADANGVSSQDRYILRCWIEMLADLRNDLAGWHSDGDIVGHDAPR